MYYILDTLLLIHLTQKNKSIKTYLLVMYGAWWCLVPFTVLGFALCIACTVETHVLACVTYFLEYYYYCSIHAVEQ